MRRARPDPGAGAGGRGVRGRGASSPPGSTTGTTSVEALELDVLAAVGGQLSYCDPDVYPVAHGDPVSNARDRLPAIRADRAAYEAILDHEGIASDDSAHRRPAGRRQRGLQADAGHRADAGRLGLRVHRPRPLRRPGGQRLGVRDGELVGPGGARSSRSWRAAAVPDLPVARHEDRHAMGAGALSRTCTPERWSGPSTIRAAGSPSVCFEPGEPPLPSDTRSFGSHWPTGGPSSPRRATPRSTVGRSAR